VGLAAVVVLALVIASRLTLPPVGSPDTSGATHQRAPDDATAPPPAPQPAPDGSAPAATLVASAVPRAPISPSSPVPTRNPAAPQPTADRAPDPAPGGAADGAPDGSTDGAPPVAAASASTASADGSDHDPRRHGSSTDSRRDARDGPDDVVDRDCDGGRHGGERR